MLCRLPRFVLRHHDSLPDPTACMRALLDTYHGVTVLKQILQAPLTLPHWKTVGRATAIRTRALEREALNPSRRGVVVTLTVLEPNPGSPRCPSKRAVIFPCTRAYG